MSERLFRVIVGGRHTGAPEEGKEKLLFGACEIATESFSRFETKRLFADGAEFHDEVLFDLGRRLPGDMAGFELLACVAESCGVRSEYTYKDQKAGTYILRDLKVGDKVKIQGGHLIKIKDPEKPVDFIK